MIVTFITLCSLTSTAELVATSPRMMDNRGRTYERVLALTRQPNTVPKLEPEV